MSDRLERLIGKANARTFWQEMDEESDQVVRRATPSEKHNVQRDSFDKLGWDMLTDQLPVLRQQIAAMAEKYETSPEAHEDLYNLLNQGDPRMQDRDKVLPQYVPQGLALDEMRQTPEFGLVRRITKYDDYKAAYALLGMRRQIEELFDQVAGAQEAMKAAEEALAEALTQAQEAAQGGQGEEEAAGDLEQALEGVANAEQDIEAQAAAAGQALVESAKEAGEQLEQEAAHMQAFGVEDGELEQMSFEERRRLAEHLNGARLTRLADLVGAFRMFSDAERRRRVNHAPAVIYDVELGNDLTKLVTEELTSLVIPELEDSFWIRYSQHALLQWKVRGPEHEGRGPILVVCDESSSMSQQLDQDGNTREMWSKAVSLGLCDQARRDGRDFIYLGFASKRQLFETTFTDGKGGIEKVVEFAEHFFHGGTEWERPLSRAMEIVDGYLQVGKMRPDIVFITDGECRVEHEFVQKFADLREHADIRCFGIQVGGEFRGYGDQLNDLTDHLISIDRLTAGPEGVQTLFRTI